MLDRPRDSAATNNETAINDLRAQLSEGLAQLDQLTVGLQAVQESLWRMKAPDDQAVPPRTAETPIPEVMAEPEPVLIQFPQVSSTWSMTGWTRSRASSRAMPDISNWS